MMDNPLQPDPTRDERIRERAYHLWEQDGCPHGRDRDYWERASELIGMEESASAGQLPNPQSHPAPNEIAPGVVVEEAEIQENLGEFPDRLADQGEHPQTPRRGRRKPPSLDNQPPTASPKPELPARADTVEDPPPLAGAAPKQAKKAAAAKVPGKKKT